MTTADELLGRLAALDRDGLANVLAHRPDVLREPWPRRLDVVAARLASAASVNEALLALPRPHLQVLRAFQLGHAITREPVPVDRAARLLGAEPAAVESVVDGLVDRALVWRDSDTVVLPDLLQRTVFRSEGLGVPVADLLDELGRTRLGQLSGALGLPPGRAELDRFYRDAERVRELFAGAPEPARKVLLDMAAGVPEVSGVPSFGTTGDWAFDHGFVFATYYGSTAMPLEVALALRGPGHQLPFTPDEPECTTTHIGVESAEATSSAAALRLLDRVSAVLELAAAEPLPLLKDGTIGTRLVRKIAKDTGGTPAELGLAIDLAAQAGLLVADEPPVPRRGQKARPATLVPNPDLARPAPALLYRLLLTTWWEPPPPDHETDVEAHLRRLVVRLLARLAPGDAITGGLTELAEWHAPNLPAEDFAACVREALADAELLGVLAHGAVTAAGRALLGPAGLVEVTDGLVARARTTALFGTDLTAIVPGSPDARLAAALDRVADREAQGTATSWRFSPATVRRAFDQGSTAAELLGELRAIATGELPQPLVYLVNDVARRHGEARVVDVASVVVGEPAVLAELAAHRKLARLGLTAVAPTVLTSTVDASGTLEALREAGYAPTRHAADGSIVLPSREPAAPAKAVVRDAEPDESPGPLDHAERLLAVPATGPALLRGQLARAMSDRYAGRLTPKQQQLCWQLEAGIPADVRYRADDGPARLVIAYPELDGDVLDVWSLGERAYRRLELARIDLT
ncbi:helicase-associated domain-containing protein [Amycolatopsis sp. OK19-0408]|uniref:Helicase-associated domain-containing protein n=1 Tax=Amycolatopsis iheyensis TaxID=2945988 RepID=A0A9X2SMV6_9PSEU|nr:helicase-associated domain-containing protein [Amycolatopsis iheyensis]MCR6486326.1 helicase-associated domain-containing protein [Amycolatopsis iheyensis]